MAHRMSPIAASFRRVVALVALLTALVAAPAVAAPVISGLHFTGSTVPVGQGGTDPYWQVVAWPSVGVTPPSLPYDAFVFSGTQPQRNVPTAWFAGDGAAGTNTGLIGLGRWIGLQQDDALSVLTGSQPLGTISAIFATTFNSDSAGTANFEFLATADNSVTFFVNGTVDTSDPAIPTITGGETLGTVSGLGSLKWVNGSATVGSGSNTLYAVVYDLNTTGTYGFTGLIVVPEPSTYASACLGLATFGLLGLRRRTARRA